jgi:hypothetical protein
MRDALNMSMVAASLITCAASVHAADWSDTSASLRHGTTFAEPFDNNADGSRKDITKGILAWPFPNVTSTTVAN